MGFNASNDADEPIAAINVTPLVDVMLVLLIIFMVTAPMMQQGVDVDLPKASSGSMKQKEDPLILSVDKKGDIYLGDKGSRIPFEAVGTKISAIVQARKEGEKKIFIKADASLDYGKVMAIMGKLHEGGITEIGLVSIPSQEVR